jgi:hypothetical protein
MSGLKTPPSAYRALRLRFARNAGPIVFAAVVGLLALNPSFRNAPLGVVAVFCVVVFVPRLVTVVLTIPAVLHGEWVNVEMRVVDDVRWGTGYPRKQLLVEVDPSQRRAFTSYGRVVEDARLGAVSELWLSEGQRVSVIFCDGESGPQIVRKLSGTKLDRKLKLLDSRERQ